MTLRTDPVILKPQPANPQDPAPVPGAQASAESTRGMLHPAPARQAQARHGGGSQTGLHTESPTHLAHTLPSRLVIDPAPLAQARASLDHGAIELRQQPWQRDIVALLNDSLATELVCSLRYRRHHHTVQGLASARIGTELMVHARQESVHADRLASRIVQLGGRPDFAPDTLTQRSHAAYDESTELDAMLRANLIAERIAVESYTQLIGLVGDKDPTTRRLLEDILAEEQEHAEELQAWLLP